MKRTARVINDKTFVYNPSAYPDGIGKLTRPEIKKDLAQVLLHMKESDISASFFYNLFGDYKGSNICNPYDIINIPPGVYHGNKSWFTTTVGLWLFNIWFIDQELFHIFGYINYTINKSKFSWMNDTLSYFLIEDKITIDNLKHFMEKSQHIMSFEIAISPNMDEELMTITKKLNKKSEELFNAHKEELDAGNVALAEELENQLIKYAEELLKDCPAMDTYMSKSGASMENFKSFFIDKGMNYNHLTGEYTMVRSNYLDGISAEDYAITAASMSAPAYSRSKKTAVGGYYSKLMSSGYQHLILDKEGSDCGTTDTVQVILTKDNVKYWMYNWMVEGGRLIELTSENRDKYIGKKVKFRFASMCKNKNGFCSKCAGNLFYRIGVKNIGVAMSQVAEKLKAKMLSEFHVSAVKVAEMDVNKAFNVK